MANRGRISKNILKWRVIIKFAKRAKISRLQNDQQIPRVQDEKYQEREAYKKM